VELFTTAQRLGFNLLRCHIKRPDPVYFEIAGRRGMLVWAALPSWQRFTPRAAAAEDLLEPTWTTSTSTAASERGWLQHRASTTITVPGSGGAGERSPSPPSGCAPPADRTPQLRRPPGRC